ncbi:MAG: Nre family DNA repair protein [Candidatus Bathyarchaeota archaeon]
MSRWYDNILPKELTLGQDVRVRSKRPSLCLMCRGGRNLCGKSICPIELKAKAYIRNANRIDAEEFVGSSPPSVFVGRFNYPHVYAGPMVPPIIGDTEIMDNPEAWLDKPVESIVNYRYSLVRGSTRMPIESARKGGKVVETLQELSMGCVPADTELELLRKPRGAVSFDDNSQPFGPSAPLKRFNVSSIKVDQRIEKTFNDGDLNASEAVCTLYNSGLQVSRMQKAFSMGVFGIKRRRKLVPTRWSITAVDSILSEKLIDEIKQHETVDKYLVYTYSYQSNNFASIFIPRSWSFEWMEAWFPETFWNIGGTEPALEGDYESFQGRTTYPGIGGCYFATRLAVSEHLRKMKRQASVLTLREIMPEFPLPLGVWFVRENIRAMLNKHPLVFEDLKSCLVYLKSFLRVPPSRWVEQSTLLKDLLVQRRLDDYFRRSELL